MKIVPIYRIPIMSPLDLEWWEDGLGGRHPMIRSLDWQLRYKLGCHYYICMHALQCGAREEDCSTPLFITKDIPDYVLDYMNHYAKVMQVGAAWYRQNYGK